MQNRYTGDIGDFAKFALLRALATGHSLSVVWYLFPDESHNTDGAHIDYLKEPVKWRHLDPPLFDALRSIVQRSGRNVRQIETSGLLGDAKFSGGLLAFEGNTAARARQRADWFREVISDLGASSIVFADPDNGLREDRDYSMADRSDWKRMPLSEAHVLSAGRTGILYHHNTRRPGGHGKEKQYWLSLLGADALALYWRRYSNRTFFIVHPTAEIKRRAEAFAEMWAPHFELHGHDYDTPRRKQPIARPASQRLEASSQGRSCPECGHTFSGKGWGGIDAHWKAKHEHIMPYDFAWPIIKAGKKPSETGSSE